MEGGGREKKDLSFLNEEKKLHNGLFNVITSHAKANGLNLGLSGPCGHVFCPHTIRILDESSEWIDTPAMT